jgi:uncharacterized protein YbbC (DUF1343 family)
MLHIVDPQIYRPFFNSISLLKAVMEIHREDFQWKAPPYEYEYEKNPIDLIIGNADLRQDLESGASLSHIKKIWDKDLESFRRWRQPYLLYS